MQPGRRRWLALAAIAGSSLVLGLDGTILVTALPTLAVELGATTDQLQWISASYTLVLAGLMIPAGALADRFGRRRLLLIALATFGLASAVASQMQTPGGLILMRAVMGGAGAFIAPISLAVLPTIFSERERPRAIAVAGAGMFLGLPLGPLIAGWLLTRYEWGAIFLINAPAVILALVGARLFIPESRDPDPPRLDLVGAVLAMAGVTLFVFGVIEQPARGWGDSTVVGSLVAGAVLIIAFWSWELRTPSPLVDLRLFARASVRWSVVAAMVMSFALLGVLFTFTPFLQIVQGKDAQATGLGLLPLIGGIVVGAAVSDRLLARVGVTMMVAIGLLVCAVGMASLSMVRADSGFELMAVTLPLIGVGNALTTFTAFNVILGTLPLTQTAGGTGLTRTLQQLAAALGVAFLGSILHSTYRSALEGQLGLLPSQVRVVAESGVAGAGSVAARLPAAAGAALSRTAANAYVDGMALVLQVCALVMVVTAALIVASMARPSTWSVDRWRHRGSEHLAPVIDEGDVA